DLRLDRQHQHLHQHAGGARHEADARLLGKAERSGRRIGIDQHQMTGLEARGQPAPRHGEAHLAGADQNDRPDIREGALSHGAPEFQKSWSRPYASPTVSNRTSLSASLADLPAQITNWKA